MIDRREEILARLEIVLAGINDGWRAFRNKEDLTESSLPAFVLFDGHEERDSIGEGITIQTNGRARVKMTPQITLHVSNHPENIGTDLNAMRLAVFKAVFTDAALLTLVTPSGAIFYDGLGNEQARGAEMTGEMLLAFAFYYPLLPSDWT